MTRSGTWTSSSGLAMRIAQGQRDDRRQDEVRERAGRGHERLAAVAALQVQRVDRRRLGPAEAERAAARR